MRKHKITQHNHSSEQYKTHLKELGLVAFYGSLAGCFLRHCRHKQAQHTHSRQMPNQDSNPSPSAVQDSTVTIWPQRRTSRLLRKPPENIGPILSTPEPIRSI